jgi:hypothetical protein
LAKSKKKTKNELLVKFIKIVKEKKNEITLSKSHNPKPPKMKEKRAVNRSLNKSN